MGPCQVFLKDKVIDEINEEAKEVGNCPGVSHGDKKTINKLTRHSIVVPLRDSDVNN
jgi:hypothetical protein